MSKKFKIPPIKNIYGISPSFLSVPKDFPSTSTFNGFWFGNSVENLPDDVIEFIKIGEAPLLLTFGSMPFKGKMDLETAIINLTEQLNTRIIVVKGWGIENTEALENNPKIKIIKTAPYEKLFPLVKAIIHHGGIGTTAECLRAGKPFFICPILHPIGDQQFWGEIAFEKGIAVRPIPLSKLTEKNFMASIKQLIHHNELYKNAELLKRKIDSENGIEKTIAEIIHKNSTI